MVFIYFSAWYLKFKKIFFGEWIAFYPQNCGWRLFSVPHWPVPCLALIGASVGLLLLLGVQTGEECPGAPSPPPGLQGQRSNMEAGPGLLACETRTLLPWKQALLCPGCRLCLQARSLHSSTEVLNQASLYSFLCLRHCQDFHSWLEYCHTWFLLGRADATSRVFRKNRLCVLSA